MYRLVVLLVLVLLFSGCSSFKVVSPQPLVQQPILTQPTYQGITQYDYKAGPPDQHIPVPGVIPDSGKDTYHPDNYPTLDSYFPQVDSPTHHFYANMGGGGGGYYYNPPVVTSTQFWTGNATVVVEQ